MKEDNYGGGVVVDIIVIFTHLMILGRWLGSLMWA